MNCLIHNQIKKTPRLYVNGVFSMGNDALLSAKADCGLAGVRKESLS